MTKQIRRARTTLDSDRLVGVIVRSDYKLSEERWELLGSFEGNVVYKLKEKRKKDGGK